jgi:hypothetical protein
MPARNNALKERLSRSREINISVIGRKTGRTITIPVWFVLGREAISLAGAGVGHAMVQERAQQSADSDRSAGRKRGIQCCS